MRGGRRGYDEEKQREIVMLYYELQNYSQVAKRLKIAPNTVRNLVLDDKKMQKHVPLLKEYERLQEESNETLLDHLKSIQYAKITKDVMDLMTPENLKAEFDARGIRSLISLMGNSFDKAMAYERLQLDKRTLELKERELQARLDNPDAFATVTIVNDAPHKKEDEQWKSA